MTEWFGELPERWDVLRISSIFSENTDNNENLTSTTALQFRYGKIIPKDVHAVDDQYLEGLKRYTLVKPNDIMLNGLNLNYDFVTQRVARVTTHGCITPAYICLRPKTSIHPEYATNLLKAMDSQKVFHGLGTGIRLTLSFSELKKSYLPHPPREEQEQIVRFLGWKVSQINRLINAKKKQIALLHEQKQAVINTAVTRGEKSIQIKKIATLFSGKGVQREVDFEEDAIPVYGSGGIFKYTDQYLHDGVAVLFGRKGTIGKPIIANGKFWVVDTMYYCVCNERVSYKYFYYMLINFPWYLYSTKTAIPSLVGNDVFNHYINLPGLEDQKLIVDYLDKKCASIDKAIEKIYVEISLLHEYRNRLISDVVTGKMDVRGVEIPIYEIVDLTAEAISEMANLPSIEKDEML